MTLQVPGSDTAHKSGLHLWLTVGAGDVQFEKMDAERPGEPGGEGEYQVQTGFGWSNGVALQLLATYGWHPERRYGPRPWV